MGIVAGQIVRGQAEQHVSTCPALVINA